MRCIKVDREDGLFLAGRDLMPTHNTLLLTLHIIRRLFKDRRRIVYTAQRWATVEDVFDRVLAIIERTRRCGGVWPRPPSEGGQPWRDRVGSRCRAKACGEGEFRPPNTRHFARGFTEIDDLDPRRAYDLVPAGWPT